MNKYLIYLLLVFCTIQQFHSQEGSAVVGLDLPVRNSLKFNRYTINPTFSFVRSQNKYISFTNKKQWVQFDNAPQSYLFSYSGRFKENIGAGIGVFQQDFGVISTFGGVLNFAYNVNISNDNNLTFGLNLGAYQSGINQGRVIVNTPDPLLQNIPSSFLFTINPGINYGTAFLDFGVSINNLVSYDISNSKVIEDNPKQAVQGHIMYTGYMNTSGFFDESKFSTLVRSEFKKDQIIASGLVMLTVPKGIWAQAGYNSLYGASAGIGLNVTKNIAFEYNYEQSMGDLSEFGNSHEVTIAYRFNKKERYNYNDDDEVQSVFNSRHKKVKANTISKDDAEIMAKRRIEIAAQRKVAAEAKKEQAKVTNSKNSTEKSDTSITSNAQNEAEKTIKTKREVEDKVKLEAEAQAKLEAEELKAKQEAQAKVEAIRLQEIEKAKADAEAKRQLEETERLKAEAATKLKLEAEAQAKLEAKELKAKQEAQAKAEAARLQEIENTKADAEAKRQLEETKRLKAEAVTKLKLEAEAQAKLKVEELKAKQEAQAKAEAIRLQEIEKAKVDAEAKRQLEETERLKVEAANKLKLVAEAQAKLEAEELKAKLEAQAKAEEVARLEEKLKLEAERLAKESEAIPEATDELSQSMKDLTKSSDQVRKVQQELLDNLSKKIAVKQTDLDDLKKENDLSEQGVYQAPKKFKSITAENEALKQVQDEIDKTIEDQNIKIVELETLYITRKKKVRDKKDPVNAFYLKTLERLKSEQLQTLRAKRDLDINLNDIKIATDFERKRRIRRAAYDNQQDRYIKDKAALNRIKKFTDESATPLTEEDFDFGEEQTRNIQIIKNVTNEENGYYMVIAVHSDTEKRDEFVTKVVASGEKNVNFFFDVTTNKYFVYYEKFNSISQAKNALNSKGSKPYNGKMSLVKIEN